MLVIGDGMLTGQLLDTWGGRAKSGSTKIINNNGSSRGAAKLTHRHTHAHKQTDWD